MIKVIHYLDSVGDGGAENLVKDYALHINKNRYDLYIVVNKLTLSSANYRVLKDNNVKLIPIYKKWNLFIRGFNHFFGYRYIPYKLKQIIDRLNPDIIHIHHDQLANIANLKGLPKTIKLFYTCHNIPELHLKKDGMEYLSAKKLIDNNNLRIIALHNKMKNDLERHLNTSSITVLNNGIDFGRFNNEENEKEKIRNSLNIPVNSFVIGCVARFVEFKNHSFLVDVFKEVSLARPDSYLLLVGSGPLKQSIIQKLDYYGLLDKVIFLENRNDVDKLLKSIDVFLLTSFHEGFCVSLIEAQRMGIKCVCSDGACADTDNVLSNKTFSLSLDSPLSTWRDTILDDSLVNSNYYNIDDFNIDNVVKKLEKMYDEE